MVIYTAPVSKNLNYGGDGLGSVPTHRVKNIPVPPLLPHRTKQFLPLPGTPEM